MLGVGNSNMICRAISEFLNDKWTDTFFFIQKDNTVYEIL